MPHIKHLFYVKSVREFIDDLEYIGKNYSIVGLTDFYQAAKERFINIKKPIAHLTFDDGLSECYNVIAPILKSKGIQATFFINSGFIDNKDLFFRFKVSLLIDDLLSKGKLTRELEVQLKDYLYSDNEVIDRLAQDNGVDYNEFLKSNKPYLTSDQIQSLIEDGFTIGAHSHDHPEFRFVSEDFALNQVVKSVDEVSSRFNQNIKAFSFPFTDFALKKEFFNRLYKSEIIDISFGTAGIKKDEIAMNFQRVPMEFKYKAKSIIGYYNLKSKMRQLLGKDLILR